MTATRALAVAAAVWLIRAVMWLLRAEYHEWGRSFAASLLRSAARRLPTADADRFEEEWLNELQAIGEMDSTPSPTGLLYALRIFARFAAWPTVRSLNTSVDATLISALGVLVFVELATPVLLVVAIIPALVFRTAGIAIEPWFGWAADGRHFSARLRRWPVMTVARGFAGFFGISFVAMALHSLVQHRILGAIAGLALLVRMARGYRHAASFHSGG